MDEAKLIEDFTNDELVEELTSRCGGLSSIDIDDLIDEIKDRAGVEYAEQTYQYRDYVVAIENGQIISGSGKVTILIVEG